MLRFVSSRVRFARFIWPFAVSGALGVTVVICVGCGQGGELIGRARGLVGRFCVVGFVFEICVGWVQS